MLFRSGIVIGCSPPPSLDAGWWRTPNHNTPETLRLTEPSPRPMLGISGLLQLLTWVEHRRVAQASQHEEGGVPCPVPHPTRLPPTRFQASNQLLGGSAPGQSSAAPVAAEPLARTSAGAKPRPKQGGRQTASMIGRPLHGMICCHQPVRRSSR